MKMILPVMLLCLIGCTNPSSDKPDEGSNSKPEKGQPVWQDEFEGNTIDTSKWTVITGDGCPDLCGFGNNELQTYSDAPENLKVEDGKLVITARKDSLYTSAKLVTEDKGDWKYGYIEVRAKLPEGRGTWPAIWMLPTLDRDMRWPRDGEIDIMEHVGYNQNMVYTTIHTEKYNHIQNTQKWDSLQVENVAQTFHTYAIDWTEEGLTWYIDGEPHYSLEKGDEDKAGWPFDEKFHLILNLAIGGGWGGRMGIDDSIWPQEFVIDYVRVYDEMPDMK